jgi:hypothetical protein
LIDEIDKTAFLYGAEDENDRGKFPKRAYLFREKAETLDGAVWSKHMNELLARNRTIQITNPE